MEINGKLLQSYQASLSGGDQVLLMSEEELKNSNMHPGKCHF